MFRPYLAISSADRAKLGQFKDVKKDLPEQISFQLSINALNERRIALYCSDANYPASEDFVKFFEAIFKENKLGIEFHQIDSAWILNFPPEHAKLVTFFIQNRVAILELEAEINSQKDPIIKQKATEILDQIKTLDFNDPKEAQLKIFQLKLSLTEAKKTLVAQSETLHRAGVRTSVRSTPTKLALEILKYNNKQLVDVLAVIDSRAGKSSTTKVARDFAKITPQTIQSLQARSSEPQTEKKKENAQQSVKSETARAGDKENRLLEHVKTFLGHYQENILSILAGDQSKLSGLNRDRMFDAQSGRQSFIGETKVDQILGTVKIVKRKREEKKMEKDHAIPTYQLTSESHLPALAGLLSVQNIPTDKKGVELLFNKIDNVLKTHPDWENFWQVVHNQAIQNIDKKYEGQQEKKAALDALPMQIEIAKVNMLCAFRFRAISILQANAQYEMGSFFTRSSPNALQLINGNMRDNAIQAIKNKNLTGPVVTPKQSAESLSSKEYKTFPPHHVKEWLKYRLKAIEAEYKLSGGILGTHKKDIKKINALIEMLDEPGGIPRVIHQLNNDFWREAKNKYGGKAHRDEDKSRNAIKFLNEHKKKHSFLRNIGCLLQDICLKTGDTIIPIDSLLKRPEHEKQFKVDDVKIAITIFSELLNNVPKLPQQNQKEISEVISNYGYFVTCGLCSPGEAITGLVATLTHYIQDAYPKAKDQHAIINTLGLNKIEELQRNAAYELKKEEKAKELKVANTSSLSVADGPDKIPEKVQLVGAGTTSSIHQKLGSTPKRKDLGPPPAPSSGMSNAAEVMRKIEAEQQAAAKQREKPTVEPPDAASTGTLRMKQ